MPLTLMYITNDPKVALIAEKNGVERIWIDLETLGKEERQKNMNTVKSHHTIEDVAIISNILTKAEMLVRINPWNENSIEEVEQVISAGADRIMLPMWKNKEEVDAFLGTVNGRVHTTLLLETKEATKCLDEVLENSLVDEVHIGLNDLHLSYNMTFMFELLSNGMVEALCKKLKKAEVAYGFGGIARIGEGTLPAERIVMEHYRLGSTRAILSRSFCNIDSFREIKSIENIFNKNITCLREYEVSLRSKTHKDYIENMLAVEKCVSEIVSRIKEKKHNE